jgi:ferredoxin
MQSAMRALSLMTGVVQRRKLVPFAARRHRLQTRPLGRASFDTAGRCGLHTSVRAGQLVKFSFVEADGEEIEVESEIGQSLLDLAHDNDIEMEGACGGECACSTCHVILPEALYSSLTKNTNIKEEEEDMLDLALGLTETSRLGCQVKVQPNFAGAKIQLPKEVQNYY